MQTLFIVNDPPYGSERTYNALRLAASLAAREGESVRVFLMGDACSTAKRGQQLPRGVPNLESLLRLVLVEGGHVAACGTCLEARGLAPDELTDGVTPNTLQDLTDWVQEADRVLVY